LTSQIVELGSILLAAKTHSADISNTYMVI